MDQECSARFSRSLSRACLSKIALYVLRMETWGVRASGRVGRDGLPTGQGGREDKDCRGGRVSRTQTQVGV